MNSILRVVTLLSAGLLAGCGESSSTQDVPAKPAAEVPATGSSSIPVDVPAEPVSTAGATHVHDLACGCSLEEVGACGNYIKVDGKFVELIGDVGLGGMAFCGQEGLKGEVEGEVQDGKFVATSFKYADL